MVAHRISAILLWTVATPVIADLSLGWAFRIGDGSKQPQGLSLCFDCGRSIRERTAHLFGAEGQSDPRDAGRVALALVRDFAVSARQRGERPIVLLIEDRRQGGVLNQLPRPVLATEKIEFVDTTDVVDPSDPANFVEDGHFTPATDAIITDGLIKLIEATPNLAEFSAPCDRRQ
jgi:hypothetical protein